ncbi:MAG: prenyltransferase/squalene oxidase repeat-containing protein, partial [Planctomycetota bacterium]
ARFLLGPKPRWPVRRIREASIERTLKVLRRMQPESGGYLEATPLTAFVVMSLAATGRGDVDVAREGKRFLDESMSGDGSWPIDTNLATWVTSLSVIALAGSGADRSWCDDSLVDWHLSCQHRKRHPFTGADPGGWGWTDLSGAVPDGDDTPAAILALLKMREECSAERQSEIDEALVHGVDWMLGLQNRNGGWPTFCRGWGKLPFDRSSTDLTAHALRALISFRDHSLDSQNAVTLQGDRRIASALRRGMQFLIRQQRRDGSWLPLWFGNQDNPDEENPVYGSSRVVLGLAVMESKTGVRQVESVRGGAYLIRCQNSDGGWGGGPSVVAIHDGTLAKSSEVDPGRGDDPAAGGGEAKFENRNGLQDRASVRDVADALEDTEARDGADRHGGESPAESVRSAHSGSADDAQGPLRDAVMESPVVSTIEETALAVESLCTLFAIRSGEFPGQNSAEPFRRNGVSSEPGLDRDQYTGAKGRIEHENGFDAIPGGTEAVLAAILGGVEFLIRRVEDQAHHRPWPIGFYFAKLWYYERLYPVVFTVAALGAFLHACGTKTR